MKRVGEKRKRKTGNFVLFFFIHSFDDEVDGVVEGVGCLWMAVGGQSRGQLPVFLSYA